MSSTAAKSTPPWRVSRIRSRGRGVFSAASRPGRRKSTSSCRSPHRRGSHLHGHGRRRRPRQSGLPCRGRRPAPFRERQSDYARGSHGGGWGIAVAQPREHVARVRNVGRSPIARSSLASLTRRSNRFRTLVVARRRRARDRPRRLRPRLARACGVFLAGRGVVSNHRPTGCRHEEALPLHRQQARVRASCLRNGS
jgi:hypothetical protein